ncbi:uncharacterized protein [Phyllobates terribilis]|uniref:uncharacterized protein n=1 Tax=Phyllobates terribilis TaxID=111132 RepID=UPI003CCB16A4
MALLLIFVVGLGFLVTSCSAGCHFEKKKMGIRGRIEKGCWKEVNGVFELHPEGSTWQEKSCDMCTCLSTGSECCSDHSVAVGYNPKICTPKVVNCTLTVVRKKDNNITCPHKVMKNSDSTDSSDSTDEKDMKDDKSKSKSKSQSRSNSNESNNNDDLKVDLEDYLVLLKYVESAEYCKEKLEEEEEEIKSKPAKSSDHSSYNN